MPISIEGTYATASGTGQATISITTHHIGDLVVMPIDLASITVHGASISASNIAWDEGRVIRNSPTGGRQSELWKGHVTAVSTATSTVTYTATNSVATYLGALQLTAGFGSGTVWSVDSTEVKTYATVTDFKYPAITPQNAGEAYVGTVRMTQTPSEGATTGYIYHTGTDAQLVVKPSCEAGLQEPSATMASGSGAGCAFMVAASGGAGAMMALLFE